MERNNYGINICSSHRRGRKLIYCRYREPFKSVSSSFPCPMLENPDSGNFCFWNYIPESGQKIEECGIQLKEFGIPLTTGKSRIQVLLTKTGIQYLESGIHGVESRIQDALGFPCIGQKAYLLYRFGH